MDLINLSIANNKLVIQEDQARLDLLFRAWEDIELENFDRPTSVPTHNLSHHLGPWKSVFKFKKSSTTKADDQEDSVKYSSNVNRQSFRHSTFSFVSVHSVTSLYPKHLTEDQSQKYDWPVHFITEFTILLRRYWKVERRSLKNNLSLFFEFVIIALIFGFLYFQLTLANFGGFQSRLGKLSI